MQLLDIHTHHVSPEAGTAIQSCLPQDFSPQPAQYYSVGFHPWYLSADGSGEDWQAFLEMVNHPQVLAIGECGLDKMAGPDLHIQEKAFTRQAEIAEKIQKPLIVHAVRTHNEIIGLKKQLNPSIPWIIHGFRGKKEQARQLTHHDIYLSFGEKYQEETILSTPLDRIFIETDESKVEIDRLYKRAAALLSLSQNEFTLLIGQNIKKVFFNR